MISFDVFCWPLVAVALVISVLNIAGFLDRRSEGLKDGVAEFTISLWIGAAVCKFLACWPGGHS